LVSRLNASLPPPHLFSLLDKSCNCKRDVERSEAGEHGIRTAKQGRTSFHSSIYSRCGSLSLVTESMVTGSLDIFTFLSTLPVLMLVHPVDPASVQHQFSPFSVRSKLGWTHYHDAHKINHHQIIMVLLRFMLCATACLALLVANAEGYDPDWAIEPIGDIIVQGVEDDMVFRYNVPTLRDGKECSVRLFEEDCITVGGSSVYMDLVDTTSVERQLTSKFRIDTETIKSSSYYTPMDPYRGRISFCTRVDCTLNGDSYNFHETKLLVDFDWTVGFAINAELGSSYTRYKLLHDYKLSLYKTDGELGDDALEVLKVAAELFLEAELNFWFRDENNPVNLTTTVLGQKMVTKQVEEDLRFLRARDMSRSLIAYQTVTGSELGIGLAALFDHDPAPHTDEVNEAQAYAWTEKADLFLGNLTAILSICGSVSVKGG
jgi:hypothetical protein